MYYVKFVKICPLGYCKDKFFPPLSHSLQKGWVNATIIFCQLTLAWKGEEIVSVGFVCLSREKLRSEDMGIALQGLDCMGDDIAAARVIYAKVNVSSK